MTIFLKILSKLSVVGMKVIGLSLQEIIQILSSVYLSEKHFTLCLGNLTTDFNIMANSRSWIHDKLASLEEEMKNISDLKKEDL